MSPGGVPFAYTERQPPMTGQPQPALTPSMLLWEVGAILARHGIPYSTENPSAALTCAERLLRALGLNPPAEPPAALPAVPQTPAGRHDSTAVLPVVEETKGWNLRLPPMGGEHGLPPRRPADRFSLGRAHLDLIDGGAS